MHNFEIEFPSDEDLVDIYGEFNATKESIQRDVKYLMGWLEKQPHLPNIKDEKFLANFLLRCKNSLEKTKHRLHLYYMCKSEMPEAYANRGELIDQILECWEILELLPMTKLTPEKRRVIIHAFTHKAGKADINVENLMKLYTTIWDLGVKSDSCRGYILIMDFANLSVSFIPVLTAIFKLGASLLSVMET